MSGVGVSVRKKRRKWLGDFIFLNLTRFFALLTLLTLAGIIISLFVTAWPSIQKFGFAFLWTSEWNPPKENFGALIPIYGTIVTSIIALVIAVPVSFGIALFLTELSPGWLRRPLGIAIELLAGIPSIVYGMWGLLVFSPIFAQAQPFLKATLGNVPLIGKLVTPPMLKESAYALGSTTWEVVWNVVLPYTKVGVIGGIMLGLGRALGETMAVTFVIGNTNFLNSASLFDPGNSITSALANEFAEAGQGLHTAALIELGLILFLITFVILAMSKLLLLRLSSGEGSKT